MPQLFTDECSSSFECKGEFCACRLPRNNYELKLIAKSLGILFGSYLLIWLLIQLEII